MPVVLGLVLVAGAWLVFAFDSWVHSGQVLPGAHVGATNVGGLSRHDAEQRLEATARQLETDPVPYKVGRDTGTVVPKDIGFDVDERSALRSALAIGRTGNPFQRFWTWLRGRLGTVRGSWGVTLDPSKATPFLQGVAFEGKSSPVEPVVTFDGVKPTLEKGVNGRGIVLEEALARLRSGFLELHRRQVVLPTGPVPPRWSDDDAMSAARKAAKTLLAAPLSVTIGNKTMDVTPDELGPLLESEPTPEEFVFAVSQDAVIARLRPKFGNVGSAPVDAKFVVEGGSVTIVPGKDGIGCCAADSASRIEAALDERDGAKRAVKLATGEVPPNVTSEDLQKLGVKTRLSEFSTEYKAGEPRVINIHKIADAMKGRVVLPGQRFSLNETIGERKEKDGYVPAPSIEYGQMTKTVGGGISQFATTLYNAVYFAGLQVDEHQPHSSWFSRYPKGREATLGYPKPDLVFTNDTPAAILVWTSWNDTTITVSIWGTSDGRKVTASEPDVREQGDCEIVKVVRTITWPDGRKKEQPYTQRYKPVNGTC